MRGSKSSVALAGLLTAAGLALSSCSLMPVADDEAPLPKQEARIAVPKQGFPSIDPELAREVRDSLAEKLGEEDRPTRNVDVVASKRIETLARGEADVTYGCLGEMLDLLDANAADQLRYDYSQDDDKDQVAWRNSTAAVLQGVLPNEFALTFPGEVQSCKDDSLPQNFVMVYRTSLMDREDKGQLHEIIGEDFTQRAATE